MTEEAAKRTQRVFPAGCTIVDIKPGTGNREGRVYATLIGPGGERLISATLDYINQQFIGASIQAETGN